MILAHLSDLHVSLYGTSLVQTRSLPREAQDDDVAWSVLREHEGWRIEAWRASQSRFRWRDRLRLVDPLGLIHEEVKVKKEPEEVWIERLEARMRLRRAGSAELLARDVPTGAALQARLADDPGNVNLRLCAVAEQLRADAPDMVLVTGDLTDDGVGYALIEAAFAPWIEAGRFVAVPGNHDIYPSPPLVTAASCRKGLDEKRRLWAGFATRAGLPFGSYVRRLVPGVVLACMDSCHPPRIPGSASGLVTQEDLNHLRGALEAFGPGEVRLGCVHHHLANPPENVAGGAPIQAGMRLRNARDVVTLAQQARLQVVMNGHRHLGYRYQPANQPLFLSAPSTTRGCRSGVAPFYWSLDVVPYEGLRHVREVPIACLASLDNPPNPASSDDEHDDERAEDNEDSIVHTRSEVSEAMAVPSEPQRGDHV